VSPEPLARPLNQSVEVRVLPSPPAMSTGSSGSPLQCIITLFVPPNPLPTNHLCHFDCHGSIAILVRSCGPARDSETPLTRGEAEPSKRKRVLLWGRSTRTRRSSNNSGRRCTSSMTSNSERASKALKGAERRRISTGFSRSKYVYRAHVLPGLLRGSSCHTGEGQGKPQWGARGRPREIFLRAFGRGTMAISYHWKSVCQVTIFKDCCPENLYLNHRRYLILSGSLFPHSKDMKQIQTPDVIDDRRLCRHIYH